MASKRIIKKVTVLGSGILGSQIACYFANIGIEVLLLDVAGKGENAKLRNKPANDALAITLKASPSPLYTKSFARNISTGNFEDDMPQIAGCDWVLDAFASQSDAKKKLYEQVEQFRGSGTLVTSALADVPVYPLTEGRSEDFRKHFCGTYFCRSSPYTPSLEIFPIRDTLPEVVDFFIFYGEKYLGRDAVPAKGLEIATLSDSGSIAKENEELIVLDNTRRTIWKNSGTTITDLGDGIINLEIHTAENIGIGEIIDGLLHAITLAEESYKGLVVFKNYSFYDGDDLVTLYKAIAGRRFDELDSQLKAYQDAMMRVRYSAVPVVAAPAGLALGRGCELCLHADKVVAHVELHMGLDAFRAGLIPVGGGAKEFTLRLSDELQDGDVEVNNFRQRFLTIAQAKLSTSAYEAFELGYLKKGRDIVVISRRRLLDEAKKQCLLLADNGYVQPVRRTNIRVLGKQALGLGYAGANSMYAGNYISEYDMKLSEKLAFVMAGGDLSQPTLVSEDYLLGLERETFIALCAEPETLERMQTILNNGNILRY